MPWGLGGPGGPEAPGAPGGHALFIITYHTKKQYTTLGPSFYFRYAMPINSTLNAPFSILNHDSESFRRDLAFEHVKSVDIAFRFAVVIGAFCLYQFPVPYDRISFWEARWASVVAVARYRCAFIA